MKFKIEVTEDFQRQAKKLLKKYPSLKEELVVLMHSLSEYPRLGKAIGNNTYKIRLAVKSKGAGKSGGMRVITYVIFKKEYVFVIAIYDKSEVENLKEMVIKDKTSEIDELLNKL